MVDSMNNARFELPESTVWVLSPERVLHSVMEVLFGEARGFTDGILLLFD
jgi:hypothetical protein